MWNGSWVWLLAGLLVSMAGGGALFWAVFSDRLNRAGRLRRCVKCWHDMTGVPSRTCPECGKAARSERALSGKRIRKRGVLLAAMIMMLAAGLAAWPDLRGGKWFGLSPLWVQAAVWPEATDFKTARIELVRKLRGKSPAYSQSLLGWSCRRALNSKDQEKRLAALAILTAAHVGSAEADAAANVLGASSKLSQNETEPLEYLLSRTQTIEQFRAICAMPMAGGMHSSVVELKPAIVRLGSGMVHEIVEALAASPYSLNAFLGVPKQALAAIVAMISDDPRAQDAFLDSVLARLNPGPFANAEPEMAAIPKFEDMFGRALGRTRDANARKRLAGMLTALWRNFSRHPTGEWTVSFAEALGDPDPLVRRACETPLKDAAGGSLQPLLVRVARGGPVALESCLEIMGYRAVYSEDPLPPEAIDLLFEGIRSTANRTGELARQAMDTLPESAHQRVIDLLDDPDPRVRSRACAVIPRLRPLALAAGARLAAMGADPALPEEVRVDARRAAEQLAELRQQVSPEGGPP